MKTNDLIYRSDALDLFGHGSSYTSEDAQRMIKELPSAETLDYEKMTIDLAIIELKYAMVMCKFDPTTGEDDCYMNKETKRQYDALDMAIRSLEAWNELKNEREEWIKSRCNPYTPDVVRAYLDEIEVRE